MEKVLSRQVSFCGSLADIEKEKETAANFFKHSNPIPKLLSGPLGFSAVGIQVQQLEGPWENISRIRSTDSSLLYCKMFFPCT